MEMNKQQAVEEADIRRLIDDHVKAIRAMNLEGTMAIYAPEIVSFDLVPPLWYQGLDAKRKAWVDAFATYKSSMGYEIRNLTTSLDNGMAFSHSLNRVSGTLKNGHQSDFWVRWTACFRKTGTNWLIVHEQISVPVDLQKGSALLDLKP